MFLLLLATGTYSQTNVYVAPFKGDKAAAISYTFDDGLLEQYTELFPMLKKYNIQASFCVNGNTINRYEKMLKTGVVEDSMLYCGIISHMSMVNAIVCGLALSMMLLLIRKNMRTSNSPSR